MYFSKFAVAGLLAVTGTIPVLASPVQGTIVARRSEMIKKDLPDGVEVHEVHDLDDDLDERKRLHDLYDDKDDYLTDTNDDDYGTDDWDDDDHFEFNRRLRRGIKPRVGRRDDDTNDFADDDGYDTPSEFGDDDNSRLRRGLRLRVSRRDDVEGVDDDGYDSPSEYGDDKRRVRRGLKLRASRRDDIEDVDDVDDDLNDDSPDRKRKLRRNEGGLDDDSDGGDD